MMKIARCLLLFLGVAGAAAAQSAPFTLEQVLSSPFPSELTAAAGGTRLAWAFKAQGHRNVFVAELSVGPGGKPRWVSRQLTPYNTDSGQEITAVQFAADGNHIIYVRGGGRNQADEIPNPTSDPDGARQEIWTIAWSGGAPRRIDEGSSPAASPKGNWVAYIKNSKVWLAPISGPGKPKEISVRGQNSSPVWSPDGSKLAMVSARGATGFGQETGGVATRTTHSFIAVFDVKKKEVSYVAASVDRDSFPRWSPDGKAIAFVRQFARAGGGVGQVAAGGFGGGGQWTIWVAHLGSGEAKQIWSSSNRPEGSPPRMAGAAMLTYAGDNRLVFASEEDGWQRLYSVSADGGTPVAITPGECEFEHVTFSRDMREVIYSSNCGDIDRRHIQRVSVTGGTPIAVTVGEGIEWAPVVTGDGKWIAYLASDARVPAMPHVRAYTAEGKGEMLAANMLPKDFPSQKLVVPQQVILTAADGEKFHNQLFLPADVKPGDKRPAVIFMHGGPVRQMMLGWHNRGYYHQAYGVNQYFAARGYVVLSVNYRSGIMYGRAFREARNRGSRGASEYQDIVAAGKYLASRPDVDPKRIGLWGGSYGGYLTALGLARDSDLFAAGVDLHGVHDWAAREIGAAATGPAAEAARVARESSPVSAVEKWKSPVLLVHGDDDRNVNYSQTVDLIARLRRQGVVFEQLVFPDEVHDFLLHKNWLKIYAATVEFFDRHMRARGSSAAEGN